MQPIRFWAKNRPSVLDLVFTKFPDTASAVNVLAPGAPMNSVLVLGVPIMPLQVTPEHAILYNSYPIFPLSICSIVLNWELAQVENTLSAYTFLTPRVLLGQYKGVRKFRV